jgi:hypothetical protein
MSKECTFAGLFCEGWVALGTVVLAVVTTFLASYTYKLWRSTSKLVEGADKTARSQLRAYVSTRAKIVRAVVGEPLRLEVDFENHGQTPAHELRIGTWSYLIAMPQEENLALPVVEVGPRRGSLWPGAKLHARLHHEITMEEAESLTAGNSKFLLRARVEYVDAFGVPCFTEMTTQADDPFAANAPLNIHHDGNRAT